MVLTAALVAWCLWAQAPAPPAPPSVPRLLEQARAARSKGNLPEALRLAGEALAREPVSREAAALKIDLAAATGDLNLALDTFDDYLTAGGRAERSLLAPVARAELRLLRKNDLSDTRAAALGALAADGDAEARKELERASLDAGRSSAAAADVALARLGDTRAAGRLAERVRQGSLAVRLSALEAIKDLQSSDPSLDTAIAAAIEDKEGPIRASAAQAAGHLKTRTAIPALRRTLNESLPYLVRLSAAVSLHQLGETAGDDLLRQALASGLAEGRTFAARAYTQAEAPVWRPAVEPLLTKGTGLDALNAAELMLSLDAAAANKVLERMTEDPNPSIRARVAKVAARHPAVAPALIRRMLSDPAPIVRLYGAEAALRRDPPASLKR
jgi:HEAT repeat protein